MAGGAGRGLLSCDAEFFGEKVWKPGKRLEGGGRAVAGVIIFIERFCMLGRNFFNGFYIEGNCASLFFKRRTNSVKLLKRFGCL